MSFANQNASISEDSTTQFTPSLVSTRAPVVGSYPSDLQDAASPPGDKAKQASAPARAGAAAASLLAHWGNPAARPEPVGLHSGTAESSVERSSPHAGETLAVSQGLDTRDVAFVQQGSSWDAVGGAWAHAKSDTSNREGVSEQRTGADQLAGGHQGAAPDAEVGKAAGVAPDQETKGRGATKPSSPGPESAAHGGTSDSGGGGTSVPGGDAGGPHGGAGAPGEGGKEAAGAPAAPGAGNTAQETFAFFLAAFPSAQAYHYGQLGGDLGTALKAEDSQLKGQLPELTAELADEAEDHQRPRADVQPSQSRISTEPVGTPPAKPDSQPTPAGKAPPQTPRPVVADEKGQANQASIAESLSSVQTRDPKIQVVPDSKPQVQLTGANDPQQNAQKRADAMSEVGQKYQEAIAKIQQGPGPEKVQPLKFSEKKNIELALNPVAVDTSELPAFKEYKGYGLPANVQTKFDELHKPKMQAATAAAKAQMDSAAQARDQKRDQEISGAKSKAKEQNRTAQQQQRTEVSSARGRIAAEKQKTQAQYAVDRRKLENDTKSRGDAASGKIKARADADQRQIDASYQQAEQQAKAAVEQGEHQAAEEKKKAERESQHKSWWQKAVSFVSDMISKLADSVCKIFDEIRNVVAGLLDKAKQFANAAIDAAARFIKDTIKEFGDFLKSAVNNLLGAVFPELARKLNDFIDRAVERAQKAVQQVADRLKEAVNQLVNALKAALDAVVGAFKAAVQIAAALAKAVISGNWAEVAKLALEAVLRLAGIDPSEFYAMVGDVADTIKAILKNPGGFIGNLIKAGAQGFRQFANNFSQHLKSGLIQWLTGAAGDIGIQMPVELSAKGIFGMTAQVLGLSFDHLKKMLTEAVKKKGKKGEKAAAMIEKAEVLSDQVQSIWEKVQEILSGGWSALWDMLSGYLDGLYEMVIGGIRNFLIQKVVMAAVQKLATMWNPIGAIVQAVLTAYNMYCWLRDNLQRIMGVVQAIFGSMKAIIGGNIGAAAGKVESVLAGLVPVAIDLLANILNIGGIGHKVREVIEKVRGKVQTALQKVVDKLVDKFWGLAERVFTKSSGKGKNSKPDASNHPMPSAQPEPAADQKDPRTMAEKEQAVDRAVTEAQAVVEDSHVSSAVVAKKLSDIKAKHKLVRLELDVKGGEYSVEAEINPKRKRAGKTTTKKQHEDQRAKVHYEEDFSTLSDSGKDRTLAAMKELKQLPGRDGEKLTGNLAKGYLVIHCGGQEFTVSMFGQDVTPVFSSGSGAGVKDTGLKIHDASKRLPHSKTQDGAKETDQVLKPAFVGIHSESPGAVVLVTNPAELQKFMEKTNQLDHRPSYVKEMKKPVEDRKDNPGFSPSTDKHSEQAFWQAMRANDSIIAGQIKAQRKIRGLSEVKIDKFEVHIHSERQMCRQCALASNETMHNLEIHLPKTAAVVKEAQRLVSVTSHQAFAGAAPQIKSTGEPDETDLVAGITAPPKNHVRAYPFVDQSSMKHLVKGSASKPGHKHKQS